MHILSVLPFPSDLLPPPFPFTNFPSSLLSSLPSLSLLVLIFSCSLKKKITQRKKEPPAPPSHQYLVSDTCQISPNSKFSLGRGGMSPDPPSSATVLAMQVPSYTSPSKNTQLPIFFQLEPCIYDCVVVVVMYTLAVTGCYVFLLLHVQRQPCFHFLVARSHVTHTSLSL